MSKKLSLQERLEILRAADLERRWYTVDDKRVCLVCEQIISGRDIQIREGPETYRLGCPTPNCPASFTHWLLYRPPSLAEAISGETAADEANAVDFFAALGGPGA